MKIAVRKINNQDWQVISTKIDISVFKMDEWDVLFVGTFLECEAYIRMSQLGIIVTSKL